MAPHNWIVLGNTISRSDRFAVAWAVSGLDVNSMTAENFFARAGDNFERVENWLVEPTTGRKVCLLKGHHYFEMDNLGKLNHADVMATYSRDESIAVITQESKWEPTAITVADTETGRSKEIYASLRKSLQAYVREHPKQRGISASRPYGDGGLAYNAVISKLTNTRLAFDCEISMPKSDAPALNLLATYAIGGDRSGLVISLKSIVKKSQ